MKLSVIDINGYPVEVTDLQEAIKTAKYYMEYRSENKDLSEFSKRQNAYWTDMYEKLIRIRTA